MQRLTGSRVANLVIVVAIICVPLLYAGMLTWAYEDPLNRIARIDAAVVNLDTPATATTPTGTSELTLGSDLAQQLSAPAETEDVGFTWHLANAAQAQAGLHSGKYRAVLTIPQNFSATMAQLSGPKAQETKPVVLQLQTDDGVNYLVGTMARTVAEKLESVSSSEGAKTFIDHTLVALGTVHDGMGAASMGAGELADGTGQLTDGGEKLATGTAKLAAGAGELSVGAEQVANGSTDLVVGLRTLAAGAVTLRDGASQLAGGTQQLATGVGQLEDGAQKLEAGSSLLATGVNGYTAAVAQLAQGQQAIITGMNAPSPGQNSSYLQGQAQLQAVLQAGTDPAHPTLRDGAEQLKAGSQQLVAGIAEAGQGAGQLRATLGGGPNPAHPNLQDGAQLQKQAAQTIADLCGAQPNDPVCVELNAQLKQAGIGGVAELPQLAGKQLVGIEGAAEGAKKISATLSAGNDPAQPTLRDGATQLQVGSQQLLLGIDQAATGARNLNTALTTAIMPGLEQINTGLRQLADKNPGLLAGMQQVASGSQALSTGTNSVAQKAPNLASGAKKLAQGSGALSQGTQTAQQGSTQLAAGALRLAAGAAQVGRGSQEAADGAQKLAGGLRSADAGAKRLATELTVGAEKIPEFSNAKAAQVAQTAGHPVQVAPERVHAVSHNGVGFAPFFLALAMWVGAIAMFFIFPALDIRRVPWEHWWTCGLRSWAITTLLGLAQAATVVAGLQLLLNLGAKDSGRLLILVMAAAICFVSINQACVASLGFRGRFVSVLLLILQIAAMGATFPIETAPAFLRFINPIMPMTYLAEGIRTAIAGGGLPLNTGIGVIALWTVSAWVVTLISARMRTSNRPMPFDPALAFPGETPKHIHSAETQVSRVVARMKG